MSSNGVTDPLVVSCEDMRAILNPIIAVYDAERADWLHATDSGDSRTNDKTWKMDWQQVGRTHDDLRRGPMAGMPRIAAQIGIDTKRVWSVINCEQKWMSFKVAEKWLQALGLEHELARIPTVPNPQWSIVRWVNYMHSRGCEGEFYYE